MRRRILIVVSLLLVTAGLGLVLFVRSGPELPPDEILISEGSAAVAATKGQDLLGPTRGMLDRAAARSESRLLGTSGGSQSFSVLPR